MKARIQLKLSNQLSLSLPQRDDCQTRKDSKYVITKPEQNIRPPANNGSITNNESTTTESFIALELTEDTGTNRGGGGLNIFFRPILCPTLLDRCACNI